MQNFSLKNTLPSKDFITNFPLKKILQEYSYQAFINFVKDTVAILYIFCGRQEELWTILADNKQIFTTSSSDLIV